MLDAGGVGGGEGAAVAGEVGGGDRSPGDGFAVEELPVAGGGFDGVAEGVAEVEDHAEAGFALVGGDDVGFDADAGGDDAGEEGGVLGVGGGEDAVGAGFEEAEELGGADDAGLDGFLEAGAELAWGEGGEGGGVGEDGEGVVEAAGEVFACEEVDAGFAADGGVDLGEEGGGELNVANAAHVDGGEEAGDVAEDAATQSQENRSAVGAGLRELFEEALDGGEAFVLLAGGDEEDGGGVLGGERLEDGGGVELPDFGGGDDEEAGERGGGAEEFAEAGGEGGEEIRADGDAVGGRRGL